MGWNYGDLMDALDARVGADVPALIHGEREILWPEFARRTNNLAAALLARGAQPGDKLAFYLRNCPEYMETLVACFKARLVHVNVNFRYLDDELWHIFDNSDAVMTVYGSEFSDRVERLRGRLPGMRQWIQVGGEAPDHGLTYEDLAGEGEGQPLDISRSPDDLLFVYTGGTTGLPKGVMWRSEDLWGALGYGANCPANEGVPPETVEVHVEKVARFGPTGRQIPACPLMHGTGLFTAIGTISGGGCIVTLPGEKFDPEQLWAGVERHRADSVVIVGDAFARPLQNALDAFPDRWDLSSLKLMVSSGVIWSRDVKLGLLAHHPGMLLFDSFGSSEAVGFGSSLTSAAGETRTARFSIGDRCKVFSEDHREVLPGSAEKGFIARCGPIPIGYYKDPKKSAETFPVIDGVRYSIPGDWCTVESDGTINLLGRGSACINTAGEKVYPEEVEEALKTHPEVEDALVVGLPDDKWGQAVTAVVQMCDGLACDESLLRRHVRDQLAGYKAPKRVFAIEKMLRAPNGKADYKAISTFAAGRLSDASEARSEA